MTTQPDELRLSAQAPRARLSATLRDKALSCDVSRPVTLLGSRRDCPLCLDDPNVSSVHCAVVNTGAELLVLDLCSRGGVQINSTKIDVAALRPGDQLQVGPLPLLLEFEQEPPVAPQRSPLPLALTIRGERIEPSAWPFLVGRRKSCHLTIDTPDVSLVHAFLFLLNGRPVIFDVGSRSGVFRNDRRVTLAELHDGDQIRIGGEKLMIERTDVRVTAASRRALPADEALKKSGTESRSVALAAATAVPGDRGLADEARELAEVIRSSQAQLADTWGRVRVFGEALAAEQVRCSQLVADCARREADLGTRAAAVDARERAVALREAAMNQKQAADEALSRQLARFRSVLQETNDVLETKAPAEAVETKHARGSITTASAAVWSAQNSVPALPVERPLFQPGAGEARPKKNVQ